jgi:hypothetical protein
MLCNSLSINLLQIQSGQCEEASLQIRAIFAGHTPVTARLRYRRVRLGFAGQRGGASRQSNVLGVRGTSELNAPAAHRRDVFDRELLGPVGLLSTSEGTSAAER